MDTGSSLMWVYCIPCIGCNTYNPIVHPSLSSTYYELPCDHDPYCAAHCNLQRNRCTYSESYADGASTSGNYAAEKITFHIENEGVTTVVDIVFGCGRVMNEPNREINGVMGLGYGSESLAKKLGTKFSYCIGDIGDQNYEYNRLIIGNGAALLGAWTPLDVYLNLYENIDGDEDTALQSEERDEPEDKDEDKDVDEGGKKYIGVYIFSQH
ncbi:hypothetical protein RJ639_043688 [Escallonia herrerae]|uniref:Peptidase A1 domain-containing protein n=1 Tax=Escallonia herrerae TaxID=1293975 RepID=A0AA89B485_9ASTE|nr:hypothetical protein RJ639_043688 [Escallonia herrerae]